MGCFPVEQQATPTGREQAEETEKESGARTSVRFSARFAEASRKFWAYVFIRSLKRLRIHGTALRLFASILQIPLFELFRRRAERAKLENGRAGGREGERFKRFG